MITRFHKSELPGRRLGDHFRISVIPKFQIRNIAKISFPIINGETWIIIDEDDNWFCCQRVPPTIPPPTFDHQTEKEPS